MPPQIVAVSGPHAGSSFALGEGGLSLGRSPENAIVVASARASRRHAEVRREGAEYVLYDLGSANGTLINGAPLVGPHRLRPGDTFAIGDESFRFEQPAPAADATLVAAPAPTPQSYQPTPPAPQGYQPTPPAPQGYQPTPPAPQGYQPPPPAPQGYQLPPGAPPAAAAAGPKKRGCPIWLAILAVVALVGTVACVGGALVLSRNVNSFFNSAATTVAGTPGPLTQATPGSGTLATPEPVEPVADKAAWTVLVYLDGDNNLEPDAIGDLNEMELVGSTDQVRIVAQVDRISSDDPRDDTSNGDWTTNKRFLITQDDDEVEIASQELDDLGELNMGDPQTLVDFAVWGMQAYPAERYALILWDHGSSWAGIAFDDTDGEKGITMPELDAALRTIQQQTGVDQIELIGFDACLMAQVDVLQTVAPYGRVMVASAELEPNEGWAWDLWLRDLVDDPQQDGAAVAEAIVDSYREFYQDGDDNTVTLSAFDLSRSNDIVTRLDELATTLTAELDSSYAVVAEARSFADAYSQPQPEQFSAIDMGHFAKLIVERGGSGVVAERAQALAAAIDGARIAEWNGGFHSNSTGISVFFPQAAELYPEFYVQASPIPRDTQWDEFLTAFHAAGDARETLAQISDLAVSSTTVGVDNSTSVQGSVSGSDIANVFFFAGVPNADDTGVTLTTVDFIYPPGSAPGEIPQWDSGTFNLSVDWNGTQWGLTNGQDTIPVLLGPAKYGTDLYGVEGVYTIQRTNEEIAAGLLFRFESGSPRLITIYGFPKGQKQEAQPFEIVPTAGDTFTAFIRSYTVSGDQLEPGLIEGDTITIGQNGLAVQLIPASSGNYVTGFLVRDISGRFSYQYQDIQVNNSGAGTAPVADPGAPQGQPSTQSGFVPYSSDKLGFSIQYPDGWETLDTGNDQIYFYDPQTGGTTFVSVDVYQLDSPDGANRRLMDAYTESLSERSGFQRGDESEVTLAGETGPAVNYAYNDDDGVEQAGVVVVITSPRTGLSYIVSLQSPSSAFESTSETFTLILESLQIQ